MGKIGVDWKGWSEVHCRLKRGKLEWGSLNWSVGVEWSGFW